MKLKISMTILFAAAAMAVISCNNETKDNSSLPRNQDTIAVNKGDATIINNDERIAVKREEVPVAVINEFDMKMPAAKNVVYTKVKVPAASDTVIIYHYYIDYDRDGYNYHAVYNANGEVMETANYKRIEGVPNAVSRAIAYNFPGYEVVETDKENDKNIEMYEVEMKKGDDKKKVKFLRDGGMFKVK